MPIDKVFALIGLARSYDADLKQLVHYDSRADTVLLDIANFLLDRGEGLGVLGLVGVGQTRTHPSLPSWAVDWTMVRYRSFSSNPWESNKVATKQRQKSLLSQLEVPREMRC